MNSMDKAPTTGLVASMPPPERLFLWAIRAWAASHADLTTVWWSLDRAFTQERVPAALPPFHQFMSALFAGLKHWPDIRCVACPHLGRDEARLLGALSQLQQGNEVRARSLLNDLVLRSAARTAVQHAAECVEIASAARMHLTTKFTNAPDVADYSEGSTGGAGLAGCASRGPH